MRKVMKKLLVFALVLTMVASNSLTAFATENQDGNAEVTTCTGLEDCAASEHEEGCEAAKTQKAADTATEEGDTTNGGSPSDNDGIMLTSLERQSEELTTLETGVVFDKETENDSYISFEINNLSATQSVEIKLYSGEILLSTTELLKTEYFSNPTLTARVVITDTSSSWKTTWAVAPIDNLVPDRAVLYVDGVMKCEADVRMYSADVPSDAREWGDIEGVAASPKGTLETGVVFDKETANDSYISFEISNLLASESVEIKLYSGETLLSTTKLAKIEYLSKTALTARVVITDTSSSWDTTWVVAPIDNLVPDKAFLYVDGVKTSEAVIRMYSADVPSDAREWGNIEGVKVSPKGTITSGYIKKNKIWGEARCNANESFVVKVYSGNTLLGTTSLVNIDGIIDGDVFVTWNAYIGEYNDEYWQTVWNENALVWNRVPDKVELYVDGVLVAENECQQNGPDNFDPINWWELDGVEGGPIVVIDADGNVSKHGTFALAVKEENIKTIIINENISEVLPTDLELIIENDVTITASSPVTVELYNEGTTNDLIIDGDSNNSVVEKLIIDKNVTLSVKDRTIWIGYHGNDVDVIVDGTLIGGYQLWVGADTTVNSTGKAVAQGEALVMRRGATLTVDGGTVNANYFQFLSGNMVAKNTEISSGPVWISNTGNYCNEGPVSILLDNVEWNSTGNLKMESNQSAILKLTNGSEMAVNLHDGYGTSMIDSNSQIVVENSAFTTAGQLTVNGKLNAKDAAFNGAILLNDGATGDIQGGSITNTNKELSAIETTGTLTLADVEITSARHAIRVKGGITTINSGYYTVLGTAGMTTHAVNAGGGTTEAKVIINGGTFIGPEGTAADSGAAVNVQDNATVEIMDGAFCCGKNDALSVNDSSSAKLIVYGGKSDKLIEKYIADGMVCALGTYPYDGEIYEYAVVDAESIKSIVDIEVKDNKTSCSGEFEQSEIEIAKAAMESLKVDDYTLIASVAAIRDKLAASDATAKEAREKLNVSDTTAVTTLVQPYMQVVVKEVNADAVGEIGKTIIGFEIKMLYDVVATTDAANPTANNIVTISTGNIVENPEAATISFELLADLIKAEAHLTENRVLYVEHLKADSSVYNHEADLEEGADKDVVSFYNNRGYSTFNLKIAENKVPADKPFQPTGGNSGSSDSSGSSNNSSDKKEESKEPTEVHYASGTSTQTSGAKTGDASNTFLWISIMGLAVAAAVAVFAIKKKSAK